MPTRKHLVSVPVSSCENALPTLAFCNATSSVSNTSVASPKQETPLRSVTGVGCYVRSKALGMMGDLPSGPYAKLEGIVNFLCSL